MKTAYSENSWKNGGLEPIVPVFQSSTVRVPPFPPSSLASSLRFSLLLAAAVLGALAGCATRDAASNPPQPKNGIAEYGEIVAASQKALEAALQSLEQVSAQ